MIVERFIFLVFASRYFFVGFPLLCIVIFAGASKISVKLSSQRTIAQLTEHQMSCETLRDGDWVKLDAEGLVPGDVVKVQDDWVLPCDMVVLRGSCVLNESALTGKVPRSSSPLDDSCRCC